MPDNNKTLSLDSQHPEKSSYLDALLDKNETKNGKKALYKLYDLGCDRFILGQFLVLLSRVEPIIIERAASGGESITIRIRHIDSIDPKTLVDGFNLPELKKIGKIAKTLKEYIENLKHTELVNHLVAHRMLADNDLLITSCTGDQLDDHNDIFYGLLNLHRFAKELNPSNRPDYTRLLKKVYLHIRERTNKWHDKEVADILNDLLPNAQPSYDEFNLKTWRQRHNLKDAKPTRRPTSKHKSSRS